MSIHTIYFTVDSEVCARWIVREVSHGASSSSKPAVRRRDNNQWVVEYPWLTQAEAGRLIKRAESTFKFDYVARHTVSHAD